VNGSGAPSTSRRPRPRRPYRRRRRRRGRVGPQLGRGAVPDEGSSPRLAGGRGVACLKGGEGDGLLISADRNPNVRGALVTGLISELPSAALDALGALIDSGAVKCVVSVGEDLAAAGLSAAQLAKVAVVYLGTHANATSAAAKIVIPTLTVFEKQRDVRQPAVPDPEVREGRARPGRRDGRPGRAGEARRAGGGPQPGRRCRCALAVDRGRGAPACDVTYANIPDAGLLLDGRPGPASFAEGPGSISSRPRRG
jgi:NADH-quinone oxidoreductase subunit G